MSSRIFLASQVLSSWELFRDLSPAALEKLTASAVLRRYPEETRIFNQGDSDVRAHVLVEGSVRISQAGSDGAQSVIRFIRPGETFGSVALFTDGRYPADAVALTASLEASWSEAELLQLMDCYPQIARNIIGIIGKRLQEAQERVRELSTQRVERRVARALLRLADQAGNSTTDGTEIEFPLRRGDVADISGTTQYTASRLLAAWEKAGWLISRNRRLTLRNSSEIRRIAEDLAG